MLYRKESRLSPGRCPEKAHASGEKARAARGKPGCRAIAPQISGARCVAFRPPAVYKPEPTGPGRCRRGTPPLPERPAPPGAARPVPGEPGSAAPAAWDRRGCRPRGPPASGPRWGLWPPRRPRPRVCPPAPPGPPWVARGRRPRKGRLGRCPGPSQGHRRGCPPVRGVPAARGRAACPGCARRPREPPGPPRGVPPRARRSARRVPPRGAPIPGGESQETAAPSRKNFRKIQGLFWHMPDALKTAPSICRNTDCACAAKRAVSAVEVEKPAAMMQWKHCRFVLDESRFKSAWQPQRKWRTLWKPT